MNKSTKHLVGAMLIMAGIMLPGCYEYRRRTVVCHRPVYRPIYHAPIIEEHYTVIEHEPCGGDVGGAIVGGLVGGAIGGLIGSSR